MKQYPMLFSTAMVQAILEDRKTQTRRVIKPQPDIIRGVRNTGIVLSNCPYGKVGDILWGRETFAQWPYPEKAPFSYAYKADGFIQREGAWERDTPNGFADVERVERWKPSIFMPREACRLFLKVQSVRVERLQDISEEDAKAEGVLNYHDEALGRKFKDYEADASGYGHPDVDYPTVESAKASFSTLWRSIYGAESWEANPWVWVIEFERLETPVGKSSD